MEATIKVLILVLAISVTVYFSLKKKLVCPKCKSKKVNITGEKKYKEDPPVALWGSPDSYYEDEYKCDNCSEVFIVKRKAIITN